MIMPLVFAVFVYVLIGWIVASICLARFIHNHKKPELASDFVLPFCFWPFVIIGAAFGLTIKLIMLLGRITEIAIRNQMNRAVRQR